MAALGNENSRVASTSEETPQELWFTLDELGAQALLPLHKGGNAVRCLQKEAPVAGLSAEL